MICQRQSRLAINTGNWGFTLLPGDAGVFPGLSNGDLGSWGLEGTAGSYFDGFNGHPGDSTTVTFETPITIFSIDASRANGSQDMTYFSLKAYYRGSVVSSVGPTFFGSVNQWSTFSVSAAAIDSIQFSAIGMGGSPPLRYLGVFGIDNVRFTMVPEPSMLALLMASAFPILLAMRGHNRKSLPKPSR